MVIVAEIAGDVLEQPYMAQIANCVCTQPHGLSKAVWRKYPSCCVYSKRERAGKAKNTARTPARPGTVVRLGHVYHLQAQWAPGKPAGRYLAWYKTFYSKPEIADTTEDRIRWFECCLRELEKIVPPDRVVAVPYLMGCGLGGYETNWPRYKALLAKSTVRFRICRL